MIPTEHEYTVATHAAAKAVYDAYAKERRPMATVEIPEWDDVPLARQRLWLERVLPIVNAAISAIPDRAQAAREVATRELNEEEARGLIMALLPDVDQTTTEAQATSVLEWIEFLLASRRFE